jgi:hypothetical protein
MANEGAPSEVPVEAASIGIEDLDVDELTALPPKRRQSRPDFMTTHFPVSEDEFGALKAEVEAASPESLGPSTRSEGGEDDGGPQADDGDDALAAVSVDEDVDIGEDDVLGGADVGTPLAPPLGHSFEGLPQTRFRPPDCAVAVGPNDVLVAVNTSLAVYDKAGTLRRRWPDMTQFFGPVLPTGAGIFDPQVHYDHYDQRWIVVIAARRDTPRGSWMLLAASQTANPLGRWWLWSLDFNVDGATPSNNWADYPMLGIDSQALFIGTNQFGFGGGFSYGKVRILNKKEIYAGAGLRWWDYWNLTEPAGGKAFTVQPCRHYRGRGNFSAYLINSEFGSGNNLVQWRISNPLALWSGGSPSLSRWEVPVGAYSLGPDARQPGTSVRIETNDDRLLNAVYQSQSGTQRIWTAHTVAVTWSGDSEPRTGVRWYEVDVGSHTAVQQRTYGSSGRYYFFPAIQVDLRRNAYLTFGRSGANEFGQLRCTGRRVSEPVNTLQGSSLVKAGESGYTGQRWGDYFGICRDGADGNRVWGYGEFADAAGTWGTWVHSNRF